MQERLTELEIRTAHQEQALEALNQVIIEQQRRIDRLEARIELLTDRIRALTPAEAADPANEPPPPHY